MRKIIIGVIILIAALAGFYIYKNYNRPCCAPPAKIDKTKLPSLPDSKEACLSLGGEWGRIGISEFEKCNLKTDDFGKRCTDSSQCEGSCLGNSNLSRAGKCSSWRITVGCHYFVNDGKVEGMLCAD